MDPAVLQQFGVELQRARAASGRSIDEIAKQTRIHRRYIEAIEAGDMAALPPGPYVPAFLREFARAVGLKVPPELSSSSSINHGLTTATVQSAPIVRPQAPSSGSFDAVTKATVETAKFAGSVAMSAVKTTGSVIKGVGEGTKEAVDIFTSRSLREEAEAVRRERRGLPPLEPKGEKLGASQAAKSSAPAPEDSPEAIPQVVPTIGAAAPPTFEEIREANDRLEARSKKPFIPLPVEITDPVAGEAVVKVGKKTKKYPVTNLVILGLLLIFAAVAYFAIQNNREQARPDVSETSLLNEDESEVETPVEPAEPEPTPEPVTASTMPVDDSLRFSITATDSVWVSIGPDSAAPFRGKLLAGDSRTFTAARKITVNIGNQKALDMMFNGTRLSNLPTIQNSGMVVRNLVLTRDRVMLNGSEVDTDGSASSPIVSKPVATASKPPAGTTTKATPTSAVKNPATTTAVKKPATTTKKPVVRKKPAPRTTIPSIDPVLPTAN